MTNSNGYEALRDQQQRDADPTPYLTDEECDEACARELVQAANFNGMTAAEQRTAEQTSLKVIPGAAAYHHAAENYECRVR